MPAGPLLTHDEYQLAIFILGPRLIGCALDIFLQGVLLCQFSHYLEQYWNSDKLGTRLAVIGLVVLTTLKSIHSFATLWTIFIIHVKDLNGAILLSYNTWWLIYSGIMVASIGVYVQAFFCYRLWIISRKNHWVIAPIVAVLVFAFISICLATYYISMGTKAGPNIRTWFAAHLSSVFAGDLLITVWTAYFLLRSRKDLLPHTVGLINSLVRLTFQTAAPAALCAMFNLLFSQTYTGDKNLISSAFNQILPKLYAFSMLWTLNARNQLRSYQIKRSYGTNGEVSTPGRENVDIIGLNNVHLRTHVSEAHSIEIRRMFHHDQSSTGTDLGQDEIKSAT
ncbi:hypothetical protein FPV67DRAFT_1672030 [Lyophyllum atratum]|nr:hypothetical protein FPV67DRAFT_1672030 [Lyophyllum atratum]